MHSASPIRTTFWMLVQSSIFCNTFKDLNVPCGNYDRLICKLKLISNSCRHCSYTTACTGYQHELMSCQFQWCYKIRKYQWNCSNIHKWRSKLLLCINENVIVEMVGFLVKCCCDSCISRTFPNPPKTQKTVERFQGGSGVASSSWAEAICLGMVHLEGRVSARNMDFPVIKVQGGLSWSVKESIYIRMVSLGRSESWREGVWFRISPERLR